jgi:hypothetical protein
MIFAYESAARPRRLTERDLRRSAGWGKKVRGFAEGRSVLVKR